MPHLTDLTTRLGACERALADLRRSLPPRAPRSRGRQSAATLLLALVLMML